MLTEKKLMGVQEPYNFIICNVTDNIIMSRYRIFACKIVMILLHISLVLNPLYTTTW